MSMSHILFGLVVFVVLSAVFQLPIVDAQYKSLETCECRELKAIHKLLETQFRLVCDTSHCEPAGNEGDGGKLP